MAYYSCPGQLFNCSGPRGIRTLDLLNAIETRSQLRYGPMTVMRLTFRTQWTWRDSNPRPLQCD